MDADARLAAWLADHVGLEDAVPGRRLGGGNSNVTQLIVHRGGQAVLRRPPDNAISASAANGVRREHRMLLALAGHARVPRALGFCEDASVIGQPFLVVEFVDGVAITRDLPAAYAEGAETLSRIGEELVDGIAAVHALDWRALGLEGPSNPAAYVQKQVERWLKARAGEAVRDLPLVEEIGRWLLERLPAAPRAAVMHGDFHLDNTLFRRDAPALAAIIDWELSTVGDPLSDLGLMLAFWGPRQVDPPGFSFVQAVTRGVPGLVTREALAARWSRTTGIDVDDLDYYLVFAFWRLASIVEGAYVLYRKGLVTDDYSRNLEHDVPALLLESALRAGLR
ncbi:MAG: phosphotransferase family protein [Steroidobacteraceae bacterium]|jgi:aminoglycoside phosphotransferase (APT) family kinase protein|nr:phosphotransferase family protein [Steroidobacteraceae bacterium]